MNGKASTQLLGNVTRDPETVAAGSSTVTKFGIAVNRSWKNKDGEKQEKVSFFDCEAWGKTGELIQEWVTKGKPLAVDGRLEQQTWEAEDGGKRSKVIVVVENFYFLPDGKDKAEGDESKTAGVERALTRPKNTSGSRATVPPSAPVDEDEIPF